MTNEQAITDIVTNNVSQAEDLRHEYDDQSNNGIRPKGSSMTYYIYIESCCAFEAESEGEAREQAIAWYIEQLQRGEIGLLVEEE